MLHYSEPQQNRREHPQRQMVLGQEWPVVPGIPSGQAHFIAELFGIAA
jgi:hypothetical protein